MNVEIVKDNKRIATANIRFSPNALLVESCDNMTLSELDRLLYQKAALPVSSEIDELIYKELKLDSRYFARAYDEVNILYAITKNFKSDDDILVYPLKDEIIYMFAFNPNITQIYVWRKRNDLNA